MYWNRYLFFAAVAAGPLNSNIRCIEILLHNCRHLLFPGLNSNIRCIEIMISVNRLQVHKCWIVTLDVLKCVQKFTAFLRLLSWIVTLDVLKLLRFYYFCRRLYCWIVTLDVLKFLLTTQNKRVRERLNSNIRCIEIDN